MPTCKGPRLLRRPKILLTPPPPTNEILVDTALSVFASFLESSKNCAIDISGFCLEIWSQASRDIFCLQQWKLVNSSVRNNAITKPSFSGFGSEEWKGNTSINVSLQDPLQGWYWDNGKQFYTENRRNISGELSHTGLKERCAVIQDSKNGIWRDSPCDEHHSFICKKKTTGFKVRTNFYQ